MNPGRKKISSRCGTVAIIGRPNTGKSTLLNCLVEEKVAIVSKIPQTTRNRIRGIYTEKRGQIIFIDTPGYFLGKDSLDKLLKKSAVRAADGVDGVIHLVDVGKPPGREEEEIVRRLKNFQKMIVLGLNKVDLKKNFTPEYIALWEKIRGCRVQDIASFVLLALSGKKGINTDKLIDVVFENLPRSAVLYPEDTVSDLPQKMMIADIIREKFHFLLRDELPHATGVVVRDAVSRRRNVFYVQADIFVERRSQKEIVVGRNGQLLKKAGIAARKELSQLLEKKIFLDMRVKVKKHWREDMALLDEMGCGQ
jgi:GTPase